MKAQLHVPQYILCMSLLEIQLLINKAVGDKNGLISVLLCIHFFVCSVRTRWVYSSTKPESGYVVLIWLQCYKWLCNVTDELENQYCNSELFSQVTPLT